MRELLVISGKGGTGKTTIAGSFAALAADKVMADCDVDAPDLYMLLNPEVVETNEFYGAKKPVIIPDKCAQCAACVEVCRFNAIFEFKINPVLCESCGVCYHVCPRGAIELKDNLAGHWFISSTAYGPLVHARLRVAEGNSGKLVAEVRRVARKLAEAKGHSRIIIEGPPGIGCPVISSLTGVEAALIVAEPSVSGIHDLRRVLRLASHFNVRAFVCINKWDMEERKTKEIEWYCYDQGVEIVGTVPFDEDVGRSIAAGRPLVEFSSGPASMAVRRMWERIEGTTASGAALAIHPA